MMSSDANVGGDSTQHTLGNVPQECYDLLSHPRRIHLLDALGAATHPVSTSDLTAELARREDADPESVRISLVHNHLPRLADHGVIERDGEAVVLVDDAAVPPKGLVALLASDATGERLLETIVTPERMAILAVLERTPVCTLETLASELTTRGETNVSGLEEAKIALHHSHLPALDDVGALEYDGSIVTAEEGTPLLR